MEQVTGMHEDNSFNLSTIEEAFDNFNQASEHLSEFYKGLEEQVSNLNDQLQTANRDKLYEYQEKEKLANRLENILRVLPGGVVVLDGNGCIAECNPVAESLLEKPLQGKQWSEVVSRCFSPRWDDGHDITLKDGRYVNISTQSLESEPGQILLIKDVTETRKLQEQFSHLKRLSAMGEMAASLAHQIRTPLSSALLYASNLSRSVVDEKVRQRFTHKIISRLQNLESLVEDMLLFSRGGRLESRAVPLTKFVESLQQSLLVNSPELNEQITFSIDIAEGMLDINQSALCSAIQNLVDNAFESGNDIKVGIAVQQTQDNLTVIISDNGPGIPDKIKHRLFEPFFTTRTKGTGLGLAVVDSVVRAHSGQLNLATDSGTGTSFSIQLPLVKQLQTDKSQEK